MRLVRRHTGHTAGVAGLAYSPDGKRLASSSQDGGVKLWDTVSGEEVLTLPSRAGGFGRLAFSPDGRRLYAANDGVVMIWDAKRRPGGER